MKVSEVFATVRATYTQIWMHSVFIALLSLVPFIYMMQVTERVYSSRSWETLWFITGLIVFLMVIWAMLGHFRSNALRALGYKIDESLRGRVYDAVHRNGTPDAFRAYGDIATLRHGLTGQAVESFFDATLSPIFVAVLFILHPVFGWFALVYIAVIAVLTWLAKSVALSAQQSARMDEDLAFAFGMATAGKSDVVRAMDLLPGIRREWQAMQARVTDTSLEGQRRAGRYEVVIDLLAQGQIVLVTFIAAVLYLSNAITAAVGFAAFLVMMRGVLPVISVARNWSLIGEVRDAATRLTRVLDEEAPIPATPLPPMQGYVECDNVGVAGRDGKPVLQGIRFALPAGTILGVIGPSGAGKSTLLRVLAGATRATSGSLRIDGFPIETWPPDQRGRDVGYLPQTMGLIPGTIWQNVARFAPFDPALNDEVVAALRTAGAMDIVQSRNRGLEFVLMDEGAPLSGGQRQRIALARAFFRTPRLLVLDEPNSALDAEGEKNLAYAVTEMKRAGSTVIFSTHKLGMLQVCDYILVLMDGYMHSFSTRDDVLQRLTAAGNPLLGAPPQSRSA
jgi:PrtD family type I secretion system ABC transporter